MKRCFLALTGALACVCTLAQHAPVLPFAYATPIARAKDADRALLVQADSTRQAIESSVKDVLVAYDTRFDGSHNQVGVLLTPFVSGPVSLAYSPSSKSVMAQWAVSQSSAFGQKLEYKTFVGEAGAVNFVLSASF
jgi:hypothetical protein